MSTRRARIKAVASLPVRKRPSAVEKSDSVDISNANGNTSATITDNSPSKETTTAVDHLHTVTDSTALCTKNERIKDANKIDTSADKTSQANNEEKKSQDIAQRRRIVKPAINIPNSSRKNKTSKVTDTVFKESNTTEEQLPLKTVVSEILLLPCNLKQTSSHLSEIENSSNLVETFENANPRSIPLKLTDKKSVKTVNLNNPDENECMLSEKVTTSVHIDGITPLMPSTIIDPIEALHDTAACDETSVLNSECSFDPIIPLPSINKNRPKLKPMPRFALRRNSLQGSASESEDDARRVKREEVVASCIPRPSPAAIIPTAPPPEGRVRHDSICSVTGDSLLSVTSRQKPLRVWRSSGVSGEVARRAAARRRALHKPPHNALTMYDLIFYNPPNNSINNPEDESKKSNKPEISTMKIDESIKDVTAEEQVEEINDKEEAMPVPQVKLGPNGEIVIDEQSLVIETSEAVRSRQRLSTWSVVYDSESAGGGLYARSRRSRDWNHSETLRFFRALNTLGTDFSLMLKLFPGRTRRDLKVKFKKEERQNSALVERALMNPLSFNIDKLEKQLEKEQEAVRLKEEMETNLKLQKKNEPRPNYRKSSIASRSIHIDEKADTIPEKKMKTIRIRSVTRSQSDTLKSDKLAEVHAKLTQAVHARRSMAPPAPKEVNPLASPTRFLPKNVEPGSMVVLSSEAPGKPNQKILQAYIVNVVNGVTKMNAIVLRPDILNSIASKMNVIDVNKQALESTHPPREHSDSDNSLSDTASRKSCPITLPACEDLARVNSIRSPLMDNCRNINFNITSHEA